MTVTTHVTIVDDDQSIREALPKMLRSYDFQADALASGHELLASSLLSTTDCLVLDVAMPGMSGLELYRELRARQFDKPIIFITAHANECLRQQMLDEGAAAFLHKPFEPTAMTDAIEAALAKN